MSTYDLSGSPPALGNNGKSSSDSEGPKSPLGWFIGVYVVVLVAAIVITIVYPKGIQWWIVVIVGSVCHAATGIKSVSEQEKGVLIFLGKVLKPLESGPCFAPWPWKIRAITKNVIQVEFGTRESETEQRAAERDVSVIYGEPFRVTFATDTRMSDDEKKKYKGDPLVGRLTFDPHVVIRFQVKDFPTFIAEIGDLDEAQEQIREAAKGAIQAYAGTHTPAQMIEEITAVNDLITDRVEKLIGEREIEPGKRLPYWGIDFRSASITSPGLPERVNEAMANRGKTAFTAEAAVVEAEAKARSAIIAANAERKKREQEGAGTAKARELLLIAEAVGVAKLAESIKTPEGKLLQQLEAMKEGLRYGKSVVLPTNLSLFTEGVAFTELLKSLNKAD